MSQMENKIERAVQISVVVPVKDEQATLSELYSRLRLELENLGRSFELIFVNDGSEDSSGKILAELAEKDARVRVIEFTRNFGKSSALGCGFSVARGDYVITIDADLQDEPKEVARFIEKLEQGFDLVSGWKRNRRDPLGKRVLSRIFNQVVRLISGVELHDFNCGYKAIQREALAGVKLYGELHRYLPVLIAHRGYKIAEIEVLHHPRSSGKSKYGIERVPRGFFDLLTIMFLTQYAYRPLHLFGGIGFGLGFLGFCALAYLTALWFLGQRPIGTRPLFMGGILLLLLGAQLLSLGLIGELFLKLNIRAEPPYIIKRVIN